MLARLSPNLPRKAPRLFGLVLLASLSACGSCKREEDAPKVIVVEDGAALRPRQLRRPFDRHHRDSGIPLLPGVGPLPSASTGAPAAPIE